MACRSASNWSVLAATMRACWPSPNGRRRGSSDRASAMEAPPLSARCCIVGGGPAGVMLGLLLARAGVDVVVLEKHADFLRDFRGDTVHPSTLEVIRELGLLESFLARPHQKMRQIAGEIAGRRIVIADFSHVPATCRFIALMPQWHFLDFLVEHARAYPTFR